MLSIQNFKCTTKLQSYHSNSCYFYKPAQTNMYQLVQKNRIQGVYGITKVVFHDFPGPFICIFQDFPGSFMFIFHVFPVPFNGMHIEQVRLSYTYAHVAHNISILHYTTDRTKSESKTKAKNERKGQICGKCSVYFPWLSKTKAWFHDFPGLENLNSNFHDFPGSVCTLRFMTDRPINWSSNFTSLTGSRWLSR